MACRSSPSCPRIRHAPGSDKFVYVPARDSVLTPGCTMIVLGDAEGVENCARRRQDADHCLDLKRGGSFINGDL